MSSEIFSASFVSQTLTGPTGPRGAQGVGGATGPAGVSPNVSNLYGNSTGACLNVPQGMTGNPRIYGTTSDGKSLATIGSSMTGIRYMNPSEYIKIGTPENEPPSGTTILVNGGTNSRPIEYLQTWGCNQLLQTEFGDEPSQTVVTGASGLNYYPIPLFTGCGFKGDGSTNIYYEYTGIMTCSWFNQPSFVSTTLDSSSYVGAFQASAYNSDFSTLTIRTGGLYLLMGTFFTDDEINPSIATPYYRITTSSGGISRYKMDIYRTTDSSQIGLENFNFIARKYPLLISISAGSTIGIDLYTSQTFLISVAFTISRLN